MSIEEPLRARHCCPSRLQDSDSTRIQIGASRPLRYTFLGETMYSTSSIQPDYAGDSVQLTHVKVDSTLDAKQMLLTLRLQPGPLTKADVGKLMMYLGERYAKMT